MRILMLTQFYPPLIGGEERSVWSLSTKLAARGHHVAVATMWHEDLLDFEIDRCVRVHRLRSTAQRVKWLYRDAGRSHVPPAPDPELTLGLRRIIEQERPHVVHAHNWLVHSFLPLKAWSRAKLVVSLHDYSLACATKKLLYRGTICRGPGPIKCLGCATDHYGAGRGPLIALANWGMGVAERRAVDMFVVVSHATAEGNGIVGTNLPCEVIPNFLPDDLDAVHSDSTPYVEQLLKNGYLLFVGAFGAYKGVDVLLRAYTRLADPPPLLLIGYTTAEYPVATTEFPPGVVIKKDWPHHAVMEAWRRSLIGLVPSVCAETLGIVALEAMATGRPVIASRVGALPDVVLDGETGLLVPPGDSYALQWAIERLLASPELRERLGRAGRERSRLFTADAVLPRFEVLYQKLVGQSPRDNEREPDFRQWRHQDL